MVISIWSPK